MLLHQVTQKGHPSPAHSVEPINVNLQGHPEYMKLLGQHANFMKQVERRAQSGQWALVALAAGGSVGTSLLGSWEMQQPSLPLAWLALMGWLCGVAFWFLRVVRRTPDVQSVGVEHLEVLGLPRLIRDHLAALHINSSSKVFNMDRFCWVGTHMQCQNPVKVSVYWLTDSLDLVCIRGQLNLEALRESFTLEECSETRKQCILAANPEVLQQLIPHRHG